MQKREHIIDWIEKALKHLMRNSEVLKNTVNVCGITSCGSTNIWRIDYFQSCMGKAIDNIDCHKDNENQFAIQRRSVCCICRVQTTFTGFYFDK